MPSVESLIAALHEAAATDVDPSRTPDVGIIMGSDSDLPVMRGAHDALVELGFSEVTTSQSSAPTQFTFESAVVSAHRTPDLMYAYAETAADRGIEVIIAGAGGKSADLPNMTASIAFPLPVIGVPVQEKSVDSVIGMPTGAPIVAVDAGKSFNAGLAAAQMLAIEHPSIRAQLEAYHEGLVDDVASTSMELRELGTMAYLEAVDNRN